MIRRYGELPMPYYIVTSRSKVEEETPFKSLHQAKCNCKTRWGKLVAKRVKNIIYRDNGIERVVAIPLYGQKEQWFTYGTVK